MFVAVLVALVPVRFLGVLVLGMLALLVLVPVALVLVLLSALVLVLRWNLPPNHNTT